MYRIDAQTIEIPVTSETATVTGSLRHENTAVNASGLRFFYERGGDSVAATDLGDGSFTGEVYTGTPVDLQFYQPGYPVDGIPDVYPVAQCMVTADTDLGGFDLPAAHATTICVVDDEGDAVPDARVRMVVTDTGEANAGLGTLRTDAAGYVNMTHSTNQQYQSPTTWDLAGSVNVRVWRPPNTTQYEFYTERTVAVTNETAITVALAEPEE